MQCIIGEICLGVVCNDLEPRQEVGLPRFFGDPCRLRSDRLPGVRGWTSLRPCTWSWCLPSIHPQLGGRRGSRCSRSCVFMKRHYSVLGKEVSESGGRTDVLQCLLHGELSASESGGGRCGWCLWSRDYSWCELTWLWKTSWWICGWAKLKT